MNWHQFQLDLNQLLRNSAQRRDEFEQQEMERKEREARELFRKYAPDSTDEGSLPLQSPPT